jgi:hypothetical protein
MKNPRSLLLKKGKAVTAPLLHAVRYRQSYFYFLMLFGLNAVFDYHFLMSDLILKDFVS